MGNAAKGTIRCEQTPDRPCLAAGAAGFAGGFNQTGRARWEVNGILRVHDTFGAEVADTWESASGQFHGSPPER